MNTKKIDDSVFEALFRQAIIDDYNEEIDSIPPKNELMEALSFSPEFELRMKKLLAREQRKETLTKAMVFGKRVAAIFIVATSVFFCGLLLSTEVRAAIKNIVVELFDEFTSFIFHGETSNPEKQAEWRPKYLPAGYQENSVEMLGKAINIEYVNAQEDVIHYSYRPEGNDTSISVDNENHIIESKTINGHEAYTAKAMKDDFENGVIWSVGEYTFSIWSKLSIEEIIKIAQSVSNEN